MLTIGQASVCLSDKVEVMAISPYYYVVNGSATYRSKRQRSSKVRQQ